MSLAQLQLCTLNSTGITPETLLFPLTFATHRHATRMWGNLLTHTMSTKWGHSIAATATHRSVAVVACVWASFSFYATVLE